MPSPVRHVVEFVKQLEPLRVLVLGYASYVLFGWLALALPICHSRPVGALDALFTSTSAVSTTGLVTISVSHDLNGLGQVVVLLLFQLGGIGYMTFGSFVVLSRRHGLDRFRKDLARRVFTLPEGIGVLHFLRSVIAFTIAIEAAGTIVLWILFARAGVPEPLWQGLFHAVSAFCTAGFSLFDQSLEPFRDDVAINLTIGTLSTLGALGFIVFTDLWDVLRRRKERVTLTTRIILHAMLWLLLAGTIGLFLCEPALRSLPFGDRLLASWFQAMTAMTTVGFDTVPTQTLSLASVMLVITLMVIGASPSGTGGGVKVTTVSALFAVTRSALRRSVTVQFWGHEVPIARVLVAAGALSLYVFVLCGAMFLLSLTEDQRFENLLFEASSALGTVGLSRGITPELTPLGKLIVLAVMFFGRVGPLTIAAAVFAAPQEEEPGDEAEAQRSPTDAGAAPEDAEETGEETATELKQEQDERQREANTAPDDSDHDGEGGKPEDVAV